ncbi:MAG: chlorite dismutase family protein [Chloroflexi bacterium]|jgi:chlorite dismutase|nr:chlorite dismutase family protein [Chloroflexota bacterium]MBT4516268.1 chlorite dismutase family protein [Chloroflexota bacterium]MBT5319284.1 chlorite dismutase family protein [Chloroflexota bacterium]
MSPSLLEGEYSKLNFYKLDRSWRQLPEEEKQASKQEFASVISEIGPESPITAYDLTGTRGDTDFMLAQSSMDMDPFDETARRINHTHLAGYLDQTYSYLAVRRVTQYKHGGAEPADLKDAYKYFIVYPMVKKREWYQLDQETRQKMMGDHFKIGHKYPTIKINTTYSFGLDDQEFVVGFETDEPREFVSLVMELREIPGGFYTESETPIFACVRKPIEEALDAIG